MTNSEQFLSYLSDMVRTHGVYRADSLADADRYYRLWSLLDSYPDHHVKLHHRGLYAVGAAMAPWTGYDRAFFFLEDLFAPIFEEKKPAEGVRAFGAFWKDLDYWPLVALAAEHGIQYGNHVRADADAESDYRMAYRLHQAGADDAVLVAALQQPALLTTHGDDIMHMPAEYMGPALGLA